MVLKYMPRMIAACAAAVCLLSGGALSASAYTPEDVAAKARNAGWPEYLIQAGLNEWSSGNYTQEDLDTAYNSVNDYSEKSGELIANSFGVDFIPAIPESTDASAEENDDAQDSPADAESDAEDPDTPVSPSEPQQLIVTKTDGTSVERISKAEFIQMSIEEKKEYVAALTEESKEEFLRGLTIEERNSILKQLPAEDKAALIQTYIDAASGMGMNVSVDTIEDNNVSMTIRNSSGQIIGKTSVGSIIDETGISHTAEWLTALLTAIVSLMGFLLLYRYISRTE